MNFKNQLTTMLEWLLTLKDTKKGFDISTFEVDEYYEARSRY